MKKESNGRREFIKKSSLTGLGAALGMGLTIPAFANDGRLAAPLSLDDKTLHIRPRYHRWHVDPGQEWLETNTRYANLDWNLPVSQTALVLLDVWQRHYIKETEYRAEKIINDKYLPLLAKVREQGMQVIHAPSPEAAMKHPNWVKLVSRVEMNPPKDTWPPVEFRNLSGPYRAYRRPTEPREAERQALPELTFHPKVTPRANEAVVATGEELHRYCKQKGILFLLYAGFNTNACIISRDYGATQMTNRGYSVSLLRDCTTGMETKETQAKLLQTNGAILLLEMFGQYSITSDEVLKGFSA
ncbi:isochorismatase family protein [Daejeonella sp.]|uniref:isochorismatase family protein n=1 Tax=Daejeonella sp. TaxID=2805397 RepID=UPI0030C29140